MVATRNQPVNTPSGNPPVPSGAKFATVQQYLLSTWHILPLCQPAEPAQPGAKANSLCGCGRKHQGRNIGKAPLTRYGVKDASNKLRDAYNWWQKWPNANIGIALEPSSLAVIAPDSPEWNAKFKEWGLPETLTAMSGGGEGHFHYYYKRPAACPITRINKPQEYDIQTGGYMVVPPSMHVSGQQYEWIAGLQWLTDPGTLPELPAWAVAMLKERGTPVQPPLDISPLPSHFLAPLDTHRFLTRSTDRDLWEGRAPVRLPDGEVDRSATLFRIGLFMARRGCSPPRIVEGLANRDHVLGFNKYMYRKDGGASAYNAIAVKALGLAAVHKQGTAAAPDVFGIEEPREIEEPGEDDHGLGRYLNGASHSDNGQKPKKPREDMTAKELWEEARTYLYTEGAVTKSPISYPYGHGYEIGDFVAESAFYARSPALRKAAAMRWLKIAQARFPRDKALERLVALRAECGTKDQLICEDPKEPHGVQIQRHRMCRSLADPYCHSQGSQNVGGIYLPDLPEGAGYTTYIIQKHIPPDRAGADNSELISDWGRLWAIEWAKAGSRKGLKDKVMHRAEKWGLDSRSPELGGLGSAMICHLMVREDVVGEARPYVEELAQRVGSDLWLMASTRSGLHATGQLTEDAAVSLIENQADSIEGQATNFISWYYGTRRRTLFQPAGATRAAYAQAKAQFAASRANFDPANVLCEAPLQKGPMKGEPCLSKCVHYKFPDWGPQAGQKVLIRHSDTPFKKTKRGREDSQQRSVKLENKPQAVAIPAAALLLL